MDIEFNPLALVLTVFISGIFIAMIWKIPTWGNYPFKNKVMISVLLPIVSYFIVLWQMDR